MIKRQHEQATDNKVALFFGESEWLNATNAEVKNAYEHGVGLGAVNFKNSVKMQQCSAQSLAQRRAETLQGVGNPEAWQQPWGCL